MLPPPHLFKWIIISFVIISDIFVLGSNKLDNYVSHYEPLTYGREEVEHQHTIHKRSLSSDRSESAATPTLQIHFQALGLKFHLILERDYSVFGDNLVVSSSDDHDILTSLSSAENRFYKGFVKGIPRSECFGTIRDGIFEGQIYTPKGTYYVERAKRFPQLSNNTSIHSVIYHENHVSDNPEMTDDESPHDQSSAFQHPKAAPLKSFAKLGVEKLPPQLSCGLSSQSVQDWMSDIQNSNPIVQDTSTDTDELNFDVGFSDESPEYKYSYEANNNDGGEEGISKRRVKRSLDNPNRNKSCSLYIQTDPLFWRHIRQQEEDDTKTQEVILSLIAQHVKAVNRIYSDTSFDGKYKHNGYQFEVQRIKIHNDSQCNYFSSQNRAKFRDRKVATSFHMEHNPFCIPNVDVSNFLNLHSKQNHEEFCLSYLFTYRDFTGGTLGLAWVASATGASGGICETYKRYTENINGVHHTAKRSLNTGIITFVNYNSRVPPKVSQLTLAHEIGHNFGSPHDWPEDCRPGGLAGNYIMFASATSGDRHNNNKFSHCSKSNISAVLDAIVDGRKGNCFIGSNGAFCGNKIVEDGEQCDCGFDQHECDADVKCCFPRKVEGASDDENKKNRCRLRPEAQCSPSEGPCCDVSTCSFVPVHSHLMCQMSRDCSEASFCDGLQARCPTPQPKPDNVTECNGGTQVCQSGECKSSICLKFGLQPCFLSSAQVSSKRQLCELACTVPSEENNATFCLSTSQLIEDKIIPSDSFGRVGDGLSLRPGSPCDNFQGYCDVFLKCRKVDAEGPLVRLKNLFFNEQTLMSIVMWVTENWWATALMGVALLFIMAIFVKCFAIHTPSSNPNMPKNLHFTETLRRPVRSFRQHPNRRPSNNRASTDNHRSSRNNQQQPPPENRNQRRTSNSNRNNGGHSSDDSSRRRRSQNDRAPPPATNQQVPTAPLPSSSGAGGFSIMPPPPPYPGAPSSSTATAAAFTATNQEVVIPPGHGYGKGRGHYNNKKRENGQQNPKGERKGGKKCGSKGKSGRSGVEMHPLR